MSPHPGYHTQASNPQCQPQNNTEIFPCAIPYTLCYSLFTRGIALKESDAFPDPEQTTGLISCIRKEKCEEQK